MAGCGLLEGVDVRGEEEGGGGQLSTKNVMSPSHLYTYPPDFTTGDVPWNNKDKNAEGWKRAASTIS